MSNITNDEKIDFIYKTLKKQESRIFWGNLFKWIFRLAILFYVIYMYYYILPGFITNLKEILTPKLSVDSLNLDTVKNLFNKK